MSFFLFFVAVVVAYVVRRIWLNAKKKKLRSSLTADPADLRAVPKVLPAHLQQRAQEINRKREARALAPLAQSPNFNASDSAHRMEKLVQKSAVQALQVSGVPVCPSCGTVLAKVPQRKTKCKHCGEFIFVKSTPNDREKRLMTPAQADAAEQAWSAHGQAAFIRSKAQHYGIDDQDLTSAFGRSGGDIDAAMCGLLNQRALLGDRLAVAGMLAHSHTAEAMMSWQRFQLETDLARMRNQGIRSVQLSLSGEKGCNVCQFMAGSVVPTTTSAGDIIRFDCERLGAETPKGCQLMAAGAIKRADGSTYVDMD